MSPLDPMMLFLSVLATAIAFLTRANSRRIVGALCGVSNAGSMFIDSCIVKWKLPLQFPAGDNPLAGTPRKSPSNVLLLNAVWDKDATGVTRNGNKERDRVRILAKKHRGQSAGPTTGRGSHRGRQCAKELHGAANDLL